MQDQLAYQIPQMLLAQHDEVVEALLLDHLHEPLRVGVLIRCQDPQLAGLSRSIAAPDAS